MNNDHLQQPEGRQGQDPLELSHNCWIIVLAANVTDHKKSTACWIYTMKTKVQSRQKPATSQVTNNTPRMT
jgi:hypothetical protein